MTRSTFRGGMLLVTTFLAGALAGVAADRAAWRRTPRGAPVTIRTPQLLDRLALSPEQRRAADAILARRSPQSEAALREIVPRLAAIADSVNAELAAILTPSQRARYDSMARAGLFLLKKRDAAGKERIDTLRTR